MWYILFKGKNNSRKNDLFVAFYSLNHIVLDMNKKNVIIKKGTKYFG